MAFHLEVQGKLLAFRGDLAEIGYDEEEAREIVQRLEERILGPVMQHTGRTLPSAEKVDGIILKRLEELE